MKKLIFLLAFACCAASAFARVPDSVKPVDEQSILFGQLYLSPEISVNAENSMDKTVTVCAYCISLQMMICASGGSLEEAANRLAQRMIDANCHLDPS